MTFQKSRFAAAGALLVAVSLGAMPASAAEIEVPRVSVAAPANLGWTSADEVYQDRRYRRHHRRYRSGVSVGDVLIGALIIGGIAAAVDSANNRDDRYRDRDYRNTRDTRADNARGLDRAAQMCVREIERDARVDSVDNVNRTSKGWNVSGRLYNGDGFSCDIGNDGRIENLNIGTGRFETSAASAQDNQWSDDVYARARMQGNPAPLREARAGMPAYPGGPIGDEDGDYYDAETDDIGG